MNEIPNSVRHLFLAAGWRPGRQVHVDANIPKDHPAYAVLGEFDGLRVGKAGSGLEVASDDIDFSGTMVPDEDYKKDWEGLLHTKLIWIADVHNAHGALIMASSGECYGCSEVHDAFYFEGRTFGEAVERMLLGKRSRPMLRPDQSEVDLYGETFKRGHPEIYDYGQFPPLAHTAWVSFAKNSPRTQRGRSYSISSPPRLCG